MKGRQRSILKAIIFLSFIILAVSAVRFTSVKEFFKEETLTHFLKESGYWAPLIFVMVYAVGVCLFVPGTLLTALGAAIFGAFEGFLYVWAGAMVGASAAFWIGRTLGRESTALMFGDRLKRYDDAIERNGFAAVFYLRMIYFPFTPMNFGMGLTKVRFWDYFLGTALGIIIGTFIFTFFIGTLREVWIRNDWGQLFSLRVFFSLAVFIVSLFIPKIMKRLKKEGGS